jgi:hypothetical protein
MAMRHGGGRFGTVWSGEWGGAMGSLRWYIPDMIQSLELIADEDGGLHLPSDLVLSPGTRAFLVVERDASGSPQLGVGEKRRTAVRFDALRLKTRDLKWTRDEVYDRS